MPSRIRRFTRSLRRYLAEAERSLAGGSPARPDCCLAKRKEPSGAMRSHPAVWLQHADPRENILS